MAETPMHIKHSQLINLDIKFTNFKKSQLYEKHKVYHFWNKFYSILKYGCHKGTICDHRL